MKKKERLYLIIIVFTLTLSSAVVFYSNSQNSGLTKSVLSRISSIGPTWISISKVSTKIISKNKCKGNDYKAWSNCVGKAIYPNGDKYEGEFINGKRSGHGTYQHTNGDKYVGDHKNDDTHGQGTYTWLNGDVYVGDHKNGSAEGKGIIKFVNGDTYKGEFKQDKQHGFGTYQYADGSKYVGEYKFGWMNGQGTYTWVGGEFDGDKYVGEYKNNKKNGQGTYRWSDGTTYVGEFYNDKQHGLGIFTYLDGSIKEGIWKNDKYVGLKFSSDNLPTKLFGITILDNPKKYISESSQGKEYNYGGILRHTWYRDENINNLKIDNYFKVFDVAVVNKKIAAIQAYYYFSSNYISQKYFREECVNRREKYFVDFLNKNNINRDKFSRSYFRGGRESKKTFFIDRISTDYNFNDTKLKLYFTCNYRFRLEAGIEKIFATFILRLSTLELSNAGEKYSNYTPTISFNETYLKSIALD